MERSAHDGSLNTVRDEVATLKRSIEKERNKRKVLLEELREVEDRVDVMMNFLDGMKRSGFIFKKRPFAAPSLELEEANSPG